MVASYYFLARNLAPHILNLVAIPEPGISLQLLKPDISVISIMRPSLKKEDANV